MDDGLPPRGYLTADEVAEQLRISRYTLLEHARRQRIASTKIGRRVLFTQADVDEYFELNRRKAIPPRRKRW